MSSARWYVFVDDSPVDWSRAVRDGVCAEPVFVIICDDAVSTPWRVLWIPQGMAVSLAQLHYAQERNSSAPIPSTRRRMPAAAATSPLPRARLRAIRDGAEA